MRYALYIFCIFSFLLATIFIVAPLYYIKIDSILTPINVTSLTEARNYYQIISSIVTIFAALLTVILGGFYYFNKIDLEDRCKKIEYAKVRIQEIFTCLENIDEYCQRIFTDSLNSDSELKYIRTRITFNLDRIVELFELNDTVIDWGNQESNPYYTFYSYVDKSNKLMRSRSITWGTRQNQVSTYHEHFKSLSTFMHNKQLSLV